MDPKVHSTGGRRSAELPRCSGMDLGGRGFWSGSHTTFSPTLDSYPVEGAEDTPFSQSEGKTRVREARIPESLRWGALRGSVLTEEGAPVQWAP